MDGLGTMIEGGEFVRAWAQQNLLLRCRNSMGHRVGYANFDPLRGHAVGLMELLWACRPCKATDPRDHYFGFLGLAPDVASEPLLAADYTKQLQQVALDYGKYFVGCGLGLHLLYLANDVKSLGEGFPTWVPNLTHVSRGGDKLWSPSEGENRGVSITCGGTGLRSLLVSGCLLDTISVLGGKKPEGEPISAWRGDWIEEVDSMVAGIEFYPSGQDIQEALCRTIVANKFPDREKADAYYIGLYGLCRYVGERFFVATDLPHDLVEALRDTPRFDIAVGMLQTSRFCITQDGFFAMVPQNSWPDDAIFTVRGDEHKATFVVRKDEARGGYQWIGHAYVHDVWTVREYEGLPWGVITVD
jgi:hypothetical protein